MQKSLVAGLLLVISGSAAAQSIPAFQSGSGGNANQAASELFFMVEQLRDEVRDLRGTVEEQQYRLDQLSKQSRDRYVDLDGRMLDLSGRVAAVEDGKQSVSGGSSGAAEDAEQQTAGKEPKEPVQFRPPGAEEEKAYQAIQEKIRAKNYETAINDLYQFLAEYPEGDLAINAYYWLGEVYLAEAELAQARQAFTIVTARFPEHRKAADALFKLGVAQDRMGEKSEARDTMKAVSEQYPGSSAAGLAKSYLSRNQG